MFVFQEPSLLSSLQDNGLTDVMLHALLIKDVSPTALHPLSAHPAFRPLHSRQCRLALISARESLSLVSMRGHSFFLLNLFSPSSVAQWTPPPPLISLTAHPLISLLSSPAHLTCLNVPFSFSAGSYINTGVASGCRAYTA